MYLSNGYSNVNMNISKAGHANKTVAMSSRELFASVPSELSVLYDVTGSDDDSEVFDEYSLITVSIDLLDIRAST